MATETLVSPDVFTADEAAAVLGSVVFELLECVT